MDDLRLRQAFFDLCEGKMRRDLNGVFFGTFTGEQIYELFKVGQLTCAFCGHTSPTKIQHKYHMMCYCEAYQKAHHEGE